MAALRSRMPAPLAASLWLAVVLALAAPAGAQVPAVLTTSAYSGASLTSPGTADVVFEGVIDDGGTALEYFFEYGPTSAYGSRTSGGTTAGGCCSRVLAAGGSVGELP